MNVGQLKHILQPFEDDKEVFAASDEEGNSFHGIHSAQLEHGRAVDQSGTDLGWLPLVLWPDGRYVEIEFAEGPT